MIITIDGTTSSGKSTAAAGLARRLGARHLDTGAMYRTLAWYCLGHGVEVQDAKAVAVCSAL